MLLFKKRMTESEMVLAIIQRDSYHKDDKPRNEGRYIFTKFGIAATWEEVPAGIWVTIFHNTVPNRPVTGEKIVSLTLDLEFLDNCRYSLCDPHHPQDEKEREEWYRREVKKMLSPPAYRDWFNKRYCRTSVSSLNLEKEINEINATIHHTLLILVAESMMNNDQQSPDDLFEQFEYQLFGSNF